MAAGNAALKQQAIATLHEGRRELHAEASWLRHELNVKRLAREFASDHLNGLMAASFAVGVVVPWAFLGRRNGKENSRPHRETQVEVKPDRASSLGGVLLKFATPLLVKQGLSFLGDYMNHGKNGNPP